MGRQPDDALGRVATRQHSLFTRAQAIAAGFSRRQIERRLALKVWLVVYARVFRSATSLETHTQRIVGAWLAAGPRAVVSHRSAAHLWGVEVPPGTAPDVTIPHGTRCRIAGIVVHRPTTLRRGDVATHLGVRIRSDARSSRNSDGVSSK
jgi:hypothetical protein